MANGQGIFMDTTGSIYEGEWVDDLQHGYGKETWNNGEITFEGNYERAKKMGHGRYDWSNGSYYEGNF